ncbi:hypothetical protein LIER_43047 [Lithospermum erythrorhizon]|uniref:Uncharacterized protein n=1 Tax=Lithospermum erythrorhizon TaxID=34254 RepID=A0AAV3PCF7_LITER
MSCNAIFLAGVSTKQQLSLMLKGKLPLFTVIIWIPLYDRVLVPIARNLTGQERGLSQLQRIGTGLFISIIIICAATLVEIKRLQLARELGMVHKAVAVPQFATYWQDSAW